VDVEDVAALLTGDRVTKALEAAPGREAAAAGLEEVKREANAVTVTAWAYTCPLFRSI